MGETRIDGVASHVLKREGVPSARTLVATRSMDGEFPVGLCVAGLQRLARNNLAIPKVRVHISDVASLDETERAFTM